VLVISILLQAIFTYACVQLHHDPEGIILANRASNDCAEADRFAGASYPIGKNESRCRDRPAHLI
jgi:hypothetical protein